MVEVEIRHLFSLYDPSTTKTESQFEPYSPPREEGWLALLTIMTRSHRNGADGVVAHGKRFRVSDHS